MQQKRGWADAGRGDHIGTRTIVNARRSAASNHFRRLTDTVGGERQLQQTTDPSAEPLMLERRVAIWNHQPVRHRRRSRERNKRSSTPFEHLAKHASKNRQASDNGCRPVWSGGSSFELGANTNRRLRAPISLSGLFQADFQAFYGSHSGAWELGCWDPRQELGHVQFFGCRRCTSNSSGVQVPSVGTGSRCTQDLRLGAGPGHGALVAKRHSLN